MRLPLYLLIAGCFLSCSGPQEPPTDQLTTPTSPHLSVPTLIVLGNVQDAGSPHIACRKDCCRDLFDKPDPARQVTALGLVDPEARQSFMFEASPDLPRQAKALKTFAGFDRELPNGIFLTHAHIGHYTGLMYLGKEATNAKGVSVYAMPRMRAYLNDNGPWSQLVATQNILLKPLSADSSLQLTGQLQVTPLLVPHRDEYSETVGYLIAGPEKTALFIPDIDKWDKWDRLIEDYLGRVDYAFLDATFYDAAELNTRDISQIPHPFVSESMQRFSSLPTQERAKIHFIHFNHTNQLLVPGSPGRAEVRKQGFNIASYGATFGL